MKWTCSLVLVKLDMGIGSKACQSPKFVLPTYLWTAPLPIG